MFPPHPIMFACCCAVEFAPALAAPAFVLALALPPPEPRRLSPDEPLAPADVPVPVPPHKLSMIFPCCIAFGLLLLSLVCVSKKMNNYKPLHYTETDPHPPYEADKIKYADSSV